MKKESINPASLFDSMQFGFSQIVVSPPGRMVFISGQVAWDKELNIVGKNDLAKQTQQSIENLKIAMESVGGSLANIVMLRIYKVKIKQGDTTIITDVLKSYFKQDPPASTWVSVDGLANEEFMIEIEAQAII